MVKSILGAYHPGLRDWIFQRLSAIYMLAYTIFLVGFFMTHTEVSYGEWHTLFSYMSMKMATLILLLALLIHAWVGVWTIFTDYVKPYPLRAILNILVILMLLASFFWGFMIVGSV